jgi:hypothetical protein
MKILSLLVILLSTSLSFAHCPQFLEVEDKKFCYSFDWLQADKRVRGKFIEVKEVSPFLNAMREIPQKRIYSKLVFKMWESGDSSHKFQSPENFKVEPYMFMESGHHHGVSFESAFLKEDEALLMSKLPLTSMRGCWSFVWRRADGQIKVLLDSFEFSNLSTEQNAERTLFCSASPDLPDDGHHGGHH